MHLFEAKKAIIFDKFIKKRDIIRLIEKYKFFCFKKTY